MIDFQNISKTFSPDTPAQVNGLVNINLKIKASEFVIIIGSNGSGKSTLLNALAGTISIDSGNIFIEDIDVSSLSDFERSKFIARIFQNPLSGTAPDLTLLENFRLAAIRTQNKSLTKGINTGFINEVKEKISMLNMNLENKLHQKMGTLSGGQRQALTLLMAVMDNCKILLMDEPVAALDPRSSEILMQTSQKVIKQFNLTAIMVTHHLKDAFNYGNRLIQMQEGKILRDLNSIEKSKITLPEIYRWFE